MWRQADRWDLICGVLFSKLIVKVCADFLLPAQNEAAMPKILLTGNVLQWDRNTDRVNSSIASLLLGSTTASLNFLLLLWVGPNLWTPRAELFTLKIIPDTSGKGESFTFIPGSSEASLTCLTVTTIPAAAQKLSTEVPFLPKVCLSWGMLHSDAQAMGNKAPQGCLTRWAWSGLMRPFLKTVKNIVDSAEEQNSEWFNWSFLACNSAFFLPGVMEGKNNLSSNWKSTELFQQGGLGEAPKYSRIFASSPEILQGQVSWQVHAVLHVK